MIYGSVFGNAHYVVRQLERTFQVAGHRTHLLEQPSARQISRKQLLMVVTSTTGAGELPARLQPLLHTLETTEIDLSGLKYALISLGDSSYTHFCGGGRRLAKALDQRGARALAPALEIDAEHCINPEDEALPWALKQIEENA